MRITGVESDCGCTVPEIQACVIPSFGDGFVDVRPTALAMGEKGNSIGVTTDSHATPVVVLRLRVIGTHTPPYFARVDENLIFRGDFTPEQSSEIHAITYENAASAPTSPRASCDLPYFEVTPASLILEKPGPLPGVVPRIYRFEAMVRGNLLKITSRATWWSRILGIPRASECSASTERWLLHNELPLPVLCSVVERWTTRWSRFSCFLASIRRTSMLTWANRRRSSPGPSYRRRSRPLRLHCQGQTGNRLQRFFSIIVRRKSTGDHLAIPVLVQGEGT